jgi:hypothetical protein
MTPDQILRNKLRKIEALFAGAATPGEKAAAGAAAERIRECLGQAAGKEDFIEWKFSIPIFGPGSCSSPMPALRPATIPP